MDSREKLINVFNDSAAMEGNEPAFREMLAAHEKEIARKMLYAQAELQTGLGVLRLELGGIDKETVKGNNLDYAEKRIAQSLVQLHKLMGELGLPMYQPERASQNSETSQAPR